MRPLFVALTAIALCAQSPVQFLDEEQIRTAAGAIEVWMGGPLRIYSGTVQAVPPLMAARFPNQYEASEAYLTNREILVSINQMRAFRSPQELAQFLSHAVAHARLGHAQRMSEVLTEAAILNTTHAPGVIAENLLTRTRREMEDATIPVAAELMRSSGCVPGPCAAFAQLLRATRP